jgi:hypothetical protein
MAEIDERVRAHLADALVPDVVGADDENLDIDSPISLE